jgi:succinate dehydrogenase / fumarate reductase membrane anchor subunit
MATQFDRTAPSAPAPSWGWLWQAITGVALVVLLAVHMVAQHFVAAHGLRDYAEVVAYLRNPLILVVELLFLVTVTTHALLGVRAIVFDFGLSDAAEKRVTWALWGVGVLTVGYGVWLTWTIIR